MDWIAGLDLGGTRLRTTAVDASDGRVRHSACSLVASVEGADGGAPFALLVQALAAMQDTVGGGLLAVGLGATGPVHPALGTITNEDTLPPWLRGPVVEVLRDRFAVPVVLLNDADAFTLGEYHAGAARDGRLVVGVTMGTGVGVGVVRDGVAAVGSGSSHPEAGHILLDPSGPACYCGGRGCWESYCSGTALGQAMDRATGERPGTWTGATVARAAAGGNATAQGVFDVMGEHLGLALTNMVAVHGPDTIVLGGGVAEARSLYLPAAEAVLRQFKYGSPDPVEVRAALLGDRAGSLGAAHAAARQVGLALGHQASEPSAAGATGPTRERR